MRRALLVALGAVVLVGGGAAAQYAFTREGAALSPPSTAEQLENERAARAIVEGAIVSGQWGDAELTSFRERFHGLSRAQQGEVLRSISLAINQGRFRPDPKKLPF